MKKLVCATTDVPANGMKEFQVEGGPELLILNSGDEYFACQAQCPHQEVRLCEGLYDGQTLTCHQHLWQWDIRSGDAVGLAEAPLRCYPLEIEGGMIYLRDE